MIDPAQYERGAIIARHRLLAFAGTELRSGREIYLHLFPRGREGFRRQLSNDILAWLTDELSVEHYKGTDYIVSPAGAEFLDIESYVHGAVERERRKYEERTAEASETAENETAEHPSTAS